MPVLLCENMEQNKNQPSQALPESPTPPIVLAPQQTIVGGEAVQSGQTPATLAAPKSNKKIKIALVIVLMTIVGITCIALFIIKILVWDKAAIDNEMNSVITPTSCAEQRKTYQQGDFIDSVPTWYINYGCTDSIETIYKNIKSSADQNGYIIEFDNNDIINAKFYSGSLCLTRNGFVTSWRFNDNHDSFDKDGQPFKPSVDVEIHSTSYFPCK